MPSSCIMGYVGTSVILASAATTSAPLKYQDISEASTIIFIINVYINV